MSAAFIDLVGMLWPAAAVSLLAALLIVATKRLHIRWSARGHNGAAVQSAHGRPTPRIGGLALLAGFVAALLLVPEDAGALLGLILLSALPVFLAGLAEDVGLGASPRARLLAAAVSGALMVAFSGEWIRSGGLPGVDWVLSFTPVAIAFTIFATAGVSHAFNLVDGINGLSKAITMSVALAYAVMAFRAGDMTLTTLSAAMVLVTLGVFLVNYPMGKVFLGDAGAYTLGHVTAWIAVLLMARYPDISPWAALLAAFWPVMDTMVAIVRRWSRAMPAGEPDRLHLHHIVLRLFLSKLGGATAMSRANPLATLALAPLFLLPPVLAVLTAHDNAAALLAYLSCALVYLGARMILVRRFRHLVRRPRPRG